MSKITAIATNTPEHAHSQQNLFEFANAVYCQDPTESRKLRFLYRQSGIETRYSVIPDYSLPIGERSFFSNSADLEPFPTLEQRMKCYSDAAVSLSVKTIRDCIKGKIDASEITHLITVSCTGMSAPGLDLDIMEEMELPVNTQRTSVNFMGCYAAIHGLKLAHAFCSSTPGANVMVLCTEFCTLHFQKESTTDNIMSSLLFADGCGAMLVQQAENEKGIRIQNFFSEVAFNGKKDMSWQLSGKGFLMTLTGYVPELLKEDFEKLVTKALAAAGKTKTDITHWCIHPGGKKILQVIEESLQLQDGELACSYEVLKNYGNMSSASVVFVLQLMLKQMEERPAEAANIFAAAFGPGLTMETFLATYD